jgi:penicillin-binding protein 1C
VVQKPVQFAANASAPNTEAPRSEWFMAGTEQASFAMDTGANLALSTPARGKKGMNNGAAPTARITSPSNGTIIALDPDIPPNNQRLTLQAEGRQLRWRLDGKPLAQGNTALWLPWPGRHHFELTDAKGKVLDEVRLEVRGAGVKGN